MSDWNNHEKIQMILASNLATDLKVEFLDMLCLEFIDDNNQKIADLYFKASNSLLDQSWR